MNVTCGDTQMRVPRRHAGDRRCNDATVTHDVIRQKRRRQRRGDKRVGTMLFERVVDARASHLSGSLAYLLSGGIRRINGMLLGVNQVLLPVVLQLAIAVSLVESDDVGESTDGKVRGGFRQVSIQPNL